MEDINATPLIPQVDQTEGNATEPQAVNLDPMITDEELSDPLATFSTAPVATFDKKPALQIAPMLSPQLEYTADIVNSLGAAPRYASTEDMRRAFNDEVHGGPLDEVLNNLTKMEGAQRKQSIMNLLNRTDLTPDERLAVVFQLEKDSNQPDQNIIERNQLKREAEAEHTGYDDESEAAFADAMQYVAEIPRIIDPTASHSPEAEVGKEEMRNAYEQFLAMQLKEAEDRQGVVNFLPNFLPFYAAVPIAKMVGRMNELLGTDMSTTQAALLNGTAVREMRERIEEMPVEQKTQFLGEVLRILKPNGGVMYQDNAWLKAYTLQNLFYKDLTGEDFVKFADEQTQKDFIKATSDADYAKTQRLKATDPVARQQWLQKQLAAEERARTIDMNSDGRLWKDAALPTWTQWMDDMAILDFTMLGPLARGTVKLGRRAGMAAFRKLAQVAPDATSKLAVRAMEDPRVRAKLGKLLGEDIAETFLPSAMKNAEEMGINGMGELIERTNRLQSEIFKARVEGSTVTDKLQRDFVAELEQTLGKTPRATLHLDKSTFEIAEDGVEYVVRYGKSTNKPFATLGSARKALADMPSHARVVQLDAKTGKYKVAGDALKDTKRGQFFVAYGDKRSYDSSRTLWEQAVFDRAQVRDPWFLRSSVAPLAKLWNWFVPSGSMFGKAITNEVAGQAMRSPVIQRLHAGLVRNLLTMPQHEQQVVSALMKQGEEMGTVFTVNQMRTLYPKISDRAITGYYEARTLADNMYTMANTQQRTEWFRNGVKQIVGKGGRIGYGKLLSRADEAVGDIKQGYQKLHVFDPDTGEFIAMSRGDIDALYAKGHSLARLEDIVQGPKFKEATHALVNSRTTLVKELPRHVLPKIPGYYPHIFQGNFVVYGVSAAGNKVALAVAKTIGDAKTEVGRIQRAMARMGKDGKTAPYSTIDYQFDRSLRDPLVATKDAADPIFGATSKVYGSRSGMMLRNASKAHGDHMVDPIESLLRGMELVSHSVTKGNLIKHMEQRLLNTVKLMERESGERIIRDPRKMVKTPEDLNYVNSVAKDHRKVLAYMQQIDMVRHIPDAVERHMAIALTWAADMFDTVASKVAKLPGGKVVAKGLDTAGGGLVSAATRGVDPTRLLTEFAHRVYIAANPIQQFALQFSQASMLLGMAPREIPAAMSRSLPLSILLYNRMNMPQIDNFDKLWSRLLKGASKLTGMKESELDKLVGVLERSGLVDSVAMHTQIRTTARSSAVARQLSTASAIHRNTPGRITMDALKTLDEATYGNLSKMGFEAGEQYNRIITFLSLYQRDVRKGVANLDKPAYVQNLVGEVNTLVGSMLRETSMGYQRGWLKAAFQFVAFQHKMAALVLTDTALSWKQKAAMSLTQFSLFGTRSAFHLDAAHRTFDSWINDYEAANPDEKNKMLELYYAPETQAMLNGLVFDYGVNTLLRTVAGEDTPDFAWNRRLAPGGGSEMIVDTLLELRNNPTEKVFGLSGKQGSKVLGFFDHLRRVMHAQALDMDDVPLEERVKSLAQEGLTLAFSGYDKYLAAAAAQEMGGWVTDTGNIVQGSDSGLEYGLAAALGLNTEDREAYYEATDRLYHDIRNDPKKHEEALDSIADQMFRRMIDDSVKFSNESPNPDVYLQLEGKEVQNRALLLSFLSRPEQERVSEKLGNKIAELIRGRRTPAQEVFYRNLTRELESGGLMDKDVLEWEVYMRRSPLFQQYPQLQSDFEQKIREITEYGEE